MQLDDGSEAIHWASSDLPCWVCRAGFQISSRYRTASATEDHPSRKEKSFVDEDESYSDDYDSDYETDPAAKIDDTMKGTVLAVAVTKKVDRRSCSMSRSMEASPQRQSGENIIARSLSQQMI